MADKYRVMVAEACAGVVGPEGLEIVTRGPSAKEDADDIMRALNRAYERGRADAHANLRTVLDL